MSELREKVALDGRGRCCGRKPIAYKGTGWQSTVRGHFCPRCCRLYDLDTREQIANWAWIVVGNGFVPKHPGSDYAAIAAVREHEVESTPPPPAGEGG